MRNHNVDRTVAEWNVIPTRAIVALALASPLHATAGAAQARGATGAAEWPAYGRDAGGSRYSPLAQITRANVKDLRLAWVYRTGDLLHDRGRFEATPLFVDGTLYLSTPLGRVIALDPEGGAERWSYDPHIDLHGDYGDFASRGVSAWLDPTRRPGARCRRRIFEATVDARLIALDAGRGGLCDDFGNHGAVDLRNGLRNPPAYPGEYAVTSPPAVVGDLVIVGSAVGDNTRTNAPGGVVRAYDARTGRERWSWDPIPRRPGMPGRDTWGGRGADTTGAANVWSVMSVDSAQDLVFVPVGSASPDFYGGERLGADLYANAVVALRASTGRLVWHFQVVHHDLWDYDVAAQPVLFTLHRGGRAIPALAQLTKMGHLFVLNRLTGKPLFPVSERPVPPSDVPGEQAWPTQPFPGPALRLVPESLPPADAFGVTPEAREECRSRIASLRSEGVFTPPSTRGTVIYPGNVGGGNWSAAAVDERHGLLVTPLNRLPFVVTLVPRAEVEALRRAHPRTEISGMRGTPYAMMREVLWSSNRIPCSPPPWGILTAVDLNSGTVKWSVPHGQVPWLADRAEARSWGSPNLGGAIVTAGGLVFAAGTWDRHLRAIDTETGRELWSAELPVGAYAMPMTYEAGGRQYVLICAGGHDRLDPELGDHVLAFTLPGRGDRGAPIPDTAIYHAAGSYAGELRIERDRDTATLDLRASGDSLTGSLEGQAPRLSGTVAARQTGNRVAFTIRFTYPEKHCSGLVTGQGDLADGGRLFEGGLQVSGECSGAEPEEGTFSLWRRP